MLDAKSGRILSECWYARALPIFEDTTLPSSSLQHRTFLTLLIAVSLAFVWILMPFANAIFWAIVLAIIFYPLQKRLMRFFPQSRNFCALITLLATVVVVLLPLGFVAQSVVAELVSLYQSAQSDSFEPGVIVEEFVKGMPKELSPLLDRFGLNDLESIKKDISEITGQAVKVIGSQAFNVGQNTFVFVVELGILLYLMFFFLRDGMRITGLINDAIPLNEAHKARFVDRFATVVRATIKGNVVIAVCQGILGGIIFWFLNIPQVLLWGTIMAVLSLLPAVGSGLVWGPVAIYFFVTGDIFKGVVLAAYGVLVISLVDNALRPILVGKATRLPDYLVLLSTLGGLAVLGMSGFVAGPLIAVLFLVSWDMFRVMNSGQESMIEVSPEDEILPPVMGNINEGVPATTDEA